MRDFEVDLGLGRVYTVPFYVLPEVAVLFATIDGPEHNFKVSEVLRLLKRKQPSQMDVEAAPLVELKRGRYDALLDEDDWSNGSLRRMAIEGSALLLFEGGESVVSHDTEENEEKDPLVCRRAWLSDLHAIEEKLAEELRCELKKTEAKEYR